MRSWPEGPIFSAVQNDLAPLEEAYGRGTLFLPDGLEMLADRPLTNGDVHAVPWEYHVDAPSSRKGQEVRVAVVIRGITIVEGEGDEATFRRHVDWAGTWAQLGISAGRPELEEPQPTVPTEPDLPPPRVSQRRLPVDGKIVEGPSQG